MDIVLLIAVVLALIVVLIGGAALIALVLRTQRRDTSAARPLAAVPATPPTTAVPTTAVIPPTTAMPVAPPAPPTTAVPVAPPAPTAQAAAEIDGLIAASRKIDAIKAYRDSTGVTLQEAKTLIDRWRPGGAPPSIPAMPSPSGAGALPAPVAAEIDGLIAAGRKIDAIKRVREQTGFGLKQAKDIIDAWAPGQR